MEAVIWSKNNCGYCVNAKKLLEMKNISYEERNITTGPWTREQLLEHVPSAKTLPQIFLDGKLVGGFTELRAFLQ